MNRPKFRHLTFVRIAKKLCSSMSHFECDCDAIVDSTYAEQYGGNDIKNYTLFIIQNDKVVNRVAWYEEHQLTALPVQDQGLAQAMIDDYLFDYD